MDNRDEKVLEWIEEVLGSLEEGQDFNFKEGSVKHFPEEHRSEVTRESVELFYIQCERARVTMGLYG
jgi:hypothetical protein